MKPQTMEQRLLKLLRRKWVSPLVALKEAHCLSLAQRVSQWRAAGISIADQWVTLESGKRVKQYRVQG
jgi:hypothetical protein